jgi:hypothetical protein
VILLAAFTVGLIAGGLTYSIHRSTAAAVLSGGAATGRALLLFNKVIGR